MELRGSMKGYYLYLISAIDRAHKKFMTLADGFNADGTKADVKTTCAMLAHATNWLFNARACGFLFFQVFCTIRDVILKVREAMKGVRLERTSC